MERQGISGCLSRSSCGIRFVASPTSSKARHRQSCRRRQRLPATFRPRIRWLFQPLGEYRLGNRCVIAPVSYGNNFLENLLPNLGFQGIGHDQIYFYSEEVAEIILQFDESQQARRLGKTDQYIQIAVGLILVANIRTEKT